MPRFAQERWNVVRDRVAYPDEESASLFISEVEEEAGVTTLESLRNACWHDLDNGNGRLAFAQTATKCMAGVTIS
jgi:hypothetical protein